MTTRTPSFTQHSTHQRLLVEPPTGERARVDAIIVPAARDVGRLREAVRLAQKLDCPLVAVCSQGADAKTVRAKSWEVPATIVAVDLPPQVNLPRMLTSTMLARTPFLRRADTATKRNLGLALTRMTGWQRVLFLDDDISGLRAPAVERAAGLLPGFGAVGLANTGYPDNSVVCHANRDTGGEQGTFIGGGALLFPAERTTSFFPDIYNEDWFFLLDHRKLTDVAVHGRFDQAQFDPYPNPRRAAQEEFGDCLAEGLFALLDDGYTLDRADLRYWRSFIPARGRLIGEILARVPQAPASALRRQQMSVSLWAAQKSLFRVEPEMCVAYLDAWRHDRVRWQRFIERLPQAVSTEQALGVLGLKS